MLPSPLHATGQGTQKLHLNLPHFPGENTQTEDDDVHQSCGHYGHYSQIARSCRSSQSWHSRRPPGWGWPAAVAVPAHPGKEPRGAVKARQWRGRLNRLHQAEATVAELCPRGQHKRNRGFGWAPAMPASAWSLCYSRANFPPSLWTTLTGLNFLSWTDKPEALERESGGSPSSWDPVRGPDQLWRVHWEAAHGPRDTGAPFLPLESLSWVHESPSASLPLISTQHPTFFSLYTEQGQREQITKDTSPSHPRPRNVAFPLLVLSCCPPKPAPSRSGSEHGINKAHYGF